MVLVIVLDGKHLKFRWVLVFLCNGCCTRELKKMAEGTCGEVVSVLTWRPAFCSLASPDFCVLENKIGMSKAQNGGISLVKILCQRVRKVSTVSDFRVGDLKENLNKLYSCEYCVSKGTLVVSLYHQML